MCHVVNEKRQKTSDWRSGTTKSRQDPKSGTTKSRQDFFREKETYKYLGILEADTIKQAEIKEKN